MGAWCRRRDSGPHRLGTLAHQRTGREQQLDAETRLHDDLSALANEIRELRSEIRELIVDMRQLIERR